MRTIPLYGGKARGRVVLIDDQDYELVSRYRWFVAERSPERRRASGPYARTNIKRADGAPTSLLMHRLITGWTKIDHINHDGLDNRRANLRQATTGQNAANARKRLDGHTSRFKGVRRAEAGRPWRAYIFLNGRQHNLGRFDNEEDAGHAYDAAAVAAWGEYAYLNFP